MKLRKFSREKADRIVEYVRAGNYVETAAAGAGIGKTTLYDWLKRGRKGESQPLIDFVAGMDEAIAHSETAAVEMIKKAAQDGVWQAAAWHLERKHPERWGRQDRAAIEGQVKAELELALSRLEQKLTTEEYDRVLSVLAPDEDSDGEAEGAEVH